MSIVFDGTATNNLDMGANRNYLRNVAGSTLMGWGLLTALGATRSMISISVGISTATRTKVSVLSAGAIELRARTLDGEATSSAFASANTVVASQRFHIACTLDYVSKVGIIYFNGALLASALLSGLTSGNTSNTAAVTGTIGAHETGTTAPWIGQLEDCRVYGRVLGPNEITTIATGRGVDGIVNELEGRWSLNERAPGTTLVDMIADRSSNGYGLTPSGTLVYGTSTVVEHRRHRTRIGPRRR